MRNSLTARCLLLTIGLTLCRSALLFANGPELPIIDDVAHQPFVAATKRLEACSVMWVRR